MPTFPTLPSRALHIFLAYMARSPSFSCTYYILRLSFVRIVTSRHFRSFRSHFNSFTIRRSFSISLTRSRSPPFVHSSLRLRCSIHSFVLLLLRRSTVHFVRYVTPPLACLIHSFALSSLHRSFVRSNVFQSRNIKQ